MRRQLLRVSVLPGSSWGPLTQTLKPRYFNFNILIRNSYDYFGKTLFMCRPFHKYEVRTPPKILRKKAVEFVRKCLMIPKDIRLVFQTFLGVGITF